MKTVNILATRYTYQVGAYLGAYIQYFMYLLEVPYPHFIKSKCTNKSISKSRTVARDIRVMSHYKSVFIIQGHEYGVSKLKYVVLKPAQWLESN